MELESSVGGSSVAVPDSSVALSNGASTISGSSFWFSPTHSLRRVKLSSVDFGGYTRGVGDDEALPVVFINRT